MINSEIVDAKPYHVGQIARKLRHEHRNSLRALDIDIHRELRSIFNASSFRKSAFIDGELVALGGVSGTLLDPLGYVWVALSEKARAHPFWVVREARKQLAQIMKTRHELATTVLPTDDAALRLACFLGFHVSHEGRGQPALSKFSRADLRDYIEKTPELRIPVGRGFAIAMGYHGEAA